MKYSLTKTDINKFECYRFLKDKTQMIKVIPPKRMKNGKIISKKSFLNRMKHTTLVAETALKILDTKNLEKIGVDKNRLYCSALLHDVGHTPYGHAGEDAINELFISKDEIYYSKYNSGVFKHNLNSIRLIGNYFNINLKNKEYILIDSILKHGSTFPKMYDYSRYQEEDILEMNYVLRAVLIDKSPLMKEFLDQFVRKANFCNSISACCLPDKNICHYCDKRNNNLCYIGLDTSKYASSMYFAYPYPLTCEGTILYWADEIACLCGDIYDTLYFIKNCVSRKNLTPIIFSSFKSKINLLLTKYGSHDILRLILECISVVEDETISKAMCNKILKKKLLNLNDSTSLINVLIDSLRTDEMKNNEVTLNFSNNNCDLLFKLDNVAFPIYKSIKGKIYSEIHNYRYIKKVNENGKNRLKEIAKMYFNNLTLFFNDYNSKTIGKRKEIYKHIGRALYSLLRVDRSVSKNAFIKEFKKEFGDIGKTISLDYDSLSKTKTLRKYLKNEECKMRVCQLLQREVLQFVATLPESTIEKIYENKKYHLKLTNLTRLPKSYNS